MAARKASRSASILPDTSCQTLPARQLYLPFGSLTARSAIQKRQSRALQLLLRLNGGMEQTIGANYDGSLLALTIALPVARQ